MSKKAKKPTTEHAYCNVCRGRTIHQIVGTPDGGGSEQDAPFWWARSYAVLQCRGCQEIVLKRTVNSEDDPGVPDVQYFPPVMSRHLPRWRFRLPRGSRELLEEIYNSLDSNGSRLPMMGARALVDMVILEKIGDVGTFKDKLKGMEKAGYIGSQGRDILYTALDLGSASAHRGHAPTPSEVQSVMDIVENMLQAVYVLPGVAKKLKDATPPRPPRKPKTP